MTSPKTTAAERCGSLFSASLSPETSKDPFNIKPSDIERFLQLNKLRNTEELIEAFPQHLRERFSLVFDTRSSQVATKESPRVILFNHNMLLAFATSKHGENANILEILEFDPVNNRFVPQFIEFDLTLQRLVLKKDQKSIEKKKCLSCHGADPRPIWDTYPAWPGFYGSDRQKLAHHVGEKSDFQKLTQNFDESSKLKYLSDLKNKTLNDVEELNNYLTATIARMHAQFLTAKVIAITNQHPEFRLAMLAALGSDAINNNLWIDLLPSSINKDMIRAETQKIYEDTHQRVQASFEKDKKRHVLLSGTSLPYNPINMDLQYVLQTARVRSLVEGILGISMRGWTTTFDPTTYRFGNGYSGVVRDIFHLYKDHLMSLPEFKGKNIRPTLISNGGHVDRNVINNLRQ